jgi:hypothetical protein
MTTPGTPDTGDGPVPLRCIPATGCFSRSRRPPSLTHVSQPTRLPGAGHAVGAAPAENAQGLYRGASLRVSAALQTYAARREAIGTRRRYAEGNGEGQSSGKQEQQGGAAALLHGNPQQAWRFNYPMPEHMDKVSITTEVP